MSECPLIVFSLINKIKFNIRLMINEAVKCPNIFMIKSNLWNACVIYSVVSICILNSF